MYFLIYAGSADVPFSSEYFKALLEINRRNNHKINVTGMLFLRMATFFRCLKGIKIKS